MSNFNQSPAQSIISSSSRFLAGYVLVSLGVLLAAGGGSWDITNHLLNKPETFFALPHAVLYSGAGAVVTGAVILFRTSRHTGKIIRPIKLIVAGMIMLVVAGPIDFAWHSAYGLDGLLSPPHFVLVSGMIVSSAGNKHKVGQAEQTIEPISRMPSKVDWSCNYQHYHASHY